MTNNDESLADAIFGIVSDDQEQPHVSHVGAVNNEVGLGDIDDLFGEPEPHKEPQETMGWNPGMGTREGWAAPETQPVVNAHTAPQYMQPPAGPVVESQHATQQPPGRNTTPDGANIVTVGGNEVYYVNVGSPTEQQRMQDAVEQVITYISADARLARFTQQLKLTRNTTADRQQLLDLEHELRTHLGNMNLTATVRDVDLLVGKVYDELIGLGPLGIPWRDDSVTEILVDAWDRIYVESDGRLVIANLRFRNENHVMSIARNLARIVSDRALSPTNPLVTAQLDGARVNFACSPVVASGIAISLRKFKPLLGMDALLQYNALTPDMRAFLADVVTARATVLVSGGTGVGKTTLINALSEAIPDTERVITIEDSYELKLANRFVVSMQTKEQASRDDDIIIDQQQLLINTLRMRPDRIVVGEIREGRAAAVMLEAASTGHDGTMTTIHANSVDSAINNRLASLVRMGSNVSDDIAKYQIAEAFDIVVQGTRRQNRRFIEEIAEVDPRNYTTDRIIPNTIFKGNLTANGTVAFERTGYLHPDGRLAEKFYIAGIDPSRWMK